MIIGEAIQQAWAEGCTKDVEVALNARRLVGRKLTEVDTYENEVLRAGAIEILNFQVGNGRVQTPFMLSVLAYLRRKGTITYRQAAAVINVMFAESQPKAQQVAVHHTGPYGVYQCTVRSCREYHREFDAMLPSHRRASGGSHLRCPSCGDAVVLLRVVDAEAVSV